MDTSEYVTEYNHRIHLVQDYLENLEGQCPSLEELSDVAGLSKYHFSRIFQSIVHESLGCYVKRIRMEKTLFLLAHRADMSLTEIALRQGFGDSAAFSRAFKKYFGISPKAYRSQYSKKCQENFRISGYDTSTVKKEGTEDVSPVTGQIELLEWKEQRAMYVRFMGTYEELGVKFDMLLQQLFARAKEHQLPDLTSGRLFAIYHDNPEFTDKQNFRTSLCLMLPDNYRDHTAAGLETMVLEAGLYAVGHFELLPGQYSAAWDFMYREWMLGSGYMPRNTYPFEVYLNAPGPGERHQVDICLPVERMKR